MKKIAIFLLLTLFLVSCGNNSNDKKNGKIVNNQVVLSYSGVTKNVDNKIKNNNLEYISIREIEEKALDKKDISLCDKLGENKNTCIDYVAIKLGNISFCVTDSCKNNISKGKAIKELDINTCKKLIDNTENKKYIKRCINTIIKRKAINSLDDKICNKIKDKKEIEVCKYYVKREKQIREESENFEDVH